ncbi:MAG: hypothetical protein ACOYOV_12980 [Bacteroidales bacterium]|jgi:hypothetical protein
MLKKQLKTSSKAIRPFTRKAIVSKTPDWAKWTFRIVFAITGVATFVIASDPSIEDTLKVQIGVYLKGVDMFVFTLSKMFGVTK